MADTAPKPAEAPKATTSTKSEAKLTDSPQWSENENGDLVFHGEYPDQARIDKDRKRISDELKDGPYDSAGLASNVTGDASEKDEDHFVSPDPAKRAFPPGPDSPADL